MFHVILLEPEIAPNTGNAIRLCANTGVDLHLVGPLGFQLDDARLRRAGLDYHEYARVRTHVDLNACLDALRHPRTFALSTHASMPFHDQRFCPGDAFLFGPESRGLGPELLATFPPGQQLRLPMRPGQRSVNLSNAVAVCVFEAWRQQHFAGAV
jgi:tRNA (cytidine/uridine-2'-O-)-methyltransferase